jgi:anion-transporting  ArsA/GET3 family ATPase
MMLDTRSTFDGLVRKHAATPEQAERILDNRFYRNIAGALSGTQEYMAMEKLHELHDEGGFDVIVIDTPPSRHALDFLDAPQRLTRLLDNRIFRMLMMPTRTYLRVAGAALQRFFKTVGKVVGAGVIDDIVAFFRAFEGMEKGFRERAGKVIELLDDPETAFVLVTSPRRDAVEEAEFFAARLAETDMEVSALVVNRVHPDFGETEEVDRLRSEAAALSVPDGGAAGPDERAAIGRLAARYENLADYAGMAARERAQLAGVAERIGARCVAYVPSLPHDIVDFGALDAVASHLLSDDTAGV